MRSTRSESQWCVHRDCEVRVVSPIADIAAEWQISHGEEIYNGELCREAEVPREEFRGMLGLFSETKFRGWFSDGKIRGARCCRRDLEAEIECRNKGITAIAYTYEDPMANGLVKWWRARFLAGYRPFSGNDFPFFLVDEHSAGTCAIWRSYVMNDYRCGYSTWRLVQSIVLQWRNDRSR